MSIGSSCITTLNPNETKHNANYYLHSVVARHHLHVHALQVVVDYYGVGGVFRGRRVFHLGGGELLGGVRSRFLRVLLVHVHHACQLGDGEAHRAAAAVQGVVDVHQVAAQSRVVGQHPVYVGPDPFDQIWYVQPLPMGALERWIADDQFGEFVTQTWIWIVLQNVQNVLEVVPAPVSSDKIHQTLERRQSNICKSK
jgi:hypothetical protein